MRYVLDSLPRREGAFDARGGLDPASIDMHGGIGPAVAASSACHSPLTQRFGDALRAQIVGQDAPLEPALEPSEAPESTHFGDPLVLLLRQEEIGPEYRAFAPIWVSQQAAQQPVAAEPDPADPPTATLPEAAVSHNELAPPIAPPAALSSDMAREAPAHPASTSAVQALMTPGATLPADAPSSTPRAAQPLHVAQVAALQTSGSRPPVQVAQQSLSALSAMSASVAALERTALGAERIGATNAAAVTHASAAHEVTDLPGAARTQASALQLQGSTVAPAQGADISPSSAAPTIPAAQTQLAGAARAPLAQALGERLHVHIARGSEHAVIRLDPPSMGSIEVVVRHEAGSIQVHLRASNSEVARQLQGMGEALRQDLSQRQQGEASVYVWDASRDADGRQQRQREWAQWIEESPSRALGADDEDSLPRFTLAQD